MEVAIAKIDVRGQQGQDMFLVVDSATKQAATVEVDPKSGRIRVLEVQSDNVKGS